jgi:hypothetical protein
MNTMQRRTDGCAGVVRAVDVLVESRSCGKAMVQVGLSYRASISKSRVEDDRQAAIHH